MTSVRHSQRYLPLWSFPPYPYIPGYNPHPNKPGGYRAGVGDPVSGPLNLDDPQDSDFLRFGLDLFNHSYYWESHIYFEALWNSHDRNGSVSLLLKGLIKLGAAGVKFQLSQTEVAIKHLESAKLLFSVVQQTEGAHFLGFDLEGIVRDIDAAERAPKATPVLLFEVHPRWPREVSEN